jgi:hypothetical protein
MMANLERSNGEDNGCCIYHYDQTITCARIYAGLQMSFKQLVAWCTLTVANLLGFEIEIGNLDPKGSRRESLEKFGPHSVSRSVPIVINTWPFTEATEAGWRELSSGGSVVDAVERGCTACEEARCDGTVGYGGSPDEEGETSLDAMVMVNEPGEELRVGAVGNLRHIKAAVATARMVMERTTHTLLTGLEATKFAQDMGLEVSNLTTDESAEMHRRW